MHEPRPPDDERVRSVEDELTPLEGALNDIQNNTHYFAQ